MPTININTIPDNAQVYVTGIVDYSRIATRIEGAELDADNARKVAKGMRAIDKPHTRLTVSQAVVNYADPAQPTIAEQYIESKFYTSPTHPEKGICFSAMNKSKNFPELYTRESIASTILENIAADGEIAIGTSVTLMLRFFSTNQNKGVSLDAVIINSKNVRWSSGNSVENHLAARGFQIANSGAVDVVRSQLAENTAAAPVAPEAPAQPAAAPYMQQAPVQQAPVQNVAPAVPTPPVAPAAAPATAAAPANPALPIPPKGYTYDENGRIVPAATQSPTGGIKL